MKEKVVPEQEQGSKVDIAFTFAAASRDEARTAFRQSVKRLLNVNQWNVLCGSLSARFDVTHPDGNPVDEAAQEGYFFRITIPGPGPTEGAGFDWVRVEKIEDRVDKSADEEQVSMRVRPAQNPGKAHSETAHFFSSEATSTFRVTRNGLDVTASVHGRNETANADTHNITDNLRNAVVSLGARAGFSALQWNSLVKGIIEGAPRSDQ